MRESQALLAFGALAQDSRLRIVRRLVRAGPRGLSAGVIADGLGVSPSNVSFHLKELERAGMIAARREARSVIYAADYKVLKGLVRFLMEDCCAGHPDICSPALVACCAPVSRRKERART